MRVRFWGTRGSIATPGPGTVRFGGNTSCVEVNTRSGDRLLLDCGTGARVLGGALMAQASGAINAAILLGHTHWDHIQGFPFFAPLFVPGNRFTVCGPLGSGRSLQDVLSGQMEFNYFPVELSELPAAIAYRELGEGTHDIDGVRVVAQYLNHPTMTLGYRIEADGAALVYMCDHEPFSETFWHGDLVPGDAESIVHEGDRRHARFMAGAGLVIHDAQYTPEEYPKHKNWGHSTYEYAVGLAAAAGVRRLVLTHHDPTHDDAFVESIEKRARDFGEKHGYGVDVRCAYEGLELAVDVNGERREPLLVATTATGPEAVGGRRILVVDDDGDIRVLARHALSQDGHSVIEASSGEEGLALVKSWSPDLLVLDLLMPDQGGLDVLKILRSNSLTQALPVLVLTGMDDEANIRAAFEQGATDYVTKPFSVPQLAARVRACLTRTAADGA
jgi:CheY-like chemotaxis protein/phosphoribosyl 1,2-cyclic phosphodiesterase